MFAMTVPVSNCRQIRYTIHPIAPVRPQKMSSDFGAQNSTAKESVAIILTINWINIVLQNTSCYKIIDRHDGSDTRRNTKSGENRIDHVDRAGEIIAVKEIAD